MAEQHDASNRWARSARLRKSAVLLLAAAAMLLAMASASFAEESWGYALGHDLMSPFCPGRTLATCPSPNAAELVQWIVMQEAAGLTREQVIEMLIERFGEQIHLYPLAGPSVGSAGLLLTPPANTIVIAGDAAVTAEHFRRGQVWRGCVDTAAAMAALRDLVEIADVIVPGHDNVMLTVRNWL